MPETQRQLAAIMFTDIVGYTALMGKNSKKALELVRISKEIQKPLVEKYNGKWIKEMGDGALAQFSTALDAVNCSVEIQEHARAKFDGKLRIGIHLGDITIENDDVYGDGVNVASRLESISDPGGIYISDAILKAIQGQSDIQTKYLGEISLKNVAYDLRTYAVQGKGLPVPVRKKNLSSDVATIQHPSKKYLIWIVIGGVFVITIMLLFSYLNFFGEHDKVDLGSVTQSENEILDRSIAVLPFDDFSPDGDQEWLSNGLMEAINLNLNNIDGLRIIGRTTMMQYKDGDKDVEDIVNELRVTHFLQGSVLKYEDNIRINVQLISATDNSQQWATSFDQKMDSIFIILDEVAINVGKELEFQFNPDELGINPAEKTDNIEAYELYLKARYIADQRWGTSPQIVKDQLEQAIALDSNFVAPYTYLGWYWLSQMVWDAKGDIDTKKYIQKGREYLEIAISKDPEYGDSYSFLGYIKLFYDQDLSEARRLLQKGLELNRTAFNMQVLGNTVLPALGEFEYALELIQEAMIESPLDPGVWSGKALNEYFIGDYASARTTLEQGITRFREGNNYNTAARVYFGMKEYSKVREVIEEYFNKNPGLRPARALGYMAAANYHLGNTDHFNKLLTELKLQAEVSPLGSPSFHISFIYAQIGEIDTSFEWLDKAYEDHEVEMYWLKVEPPFEPLRSDPRWKEMLNKVGFPE